MAPFFSVPANPLLGLWLGTANAWTGALASDWFVETQRRQAEAMATLWRETLRFWTGSWMMLPMPPEPRVMQRPQLTVLEGGAALDAAPPMPAEAPPMPLPSASPKVPSPAEITDAEDLAPEAPTPEAPTVKNAAPALPPAADPAKESSPRAQVTPEALAPAKRSAAPLRAGGKPRGEAVKPRNETPPRGPRRKGPQG